MITKIEEVPPIHSIESGSSGPYYVLYVFPLSHRTEQTDKNTYSMFCDGKDHAEDIIENLLARKRNMVRVFLAKIDTITEYQAIKTKACIIPIASSLDAVIDAGE